jgi:hypothetical protein
LLLFLEMYCLVGNMPLSGAEKTRRYREKLKKERPDEYKAQCSRNLQRLKSKRKKISDMTPLEAEQQREQWRQEKRKSDAKKKREKLRTETATERVVTGNDKKNETVLKMYKSILRRCKNVTNVLKKIRTQKETYKKRYQRLKNKTAKTIKNLESTILKLKAREEILELSLKKTYSASKTHAEKGSLKKIVKNSKNKTYVCKLMGLKTKPRSRKKIVRRAIIPEIQQFYLRDGISRNTAGKKETRTKHKEKEQIRYLTDTLNNLYQKYKSEGGRYGFTTFYNNKPFYVLSPRLSSRNTCLCVKHSNIDFLHNAMLKNKVLQFGIKDLLKSVACDVKNYQCMHNKCKDCKSKTLSFEDVDNDKEVSWFRWESQKHTYTKKDGKESKDMVTKRITKVVKTGNISELKSIFSKDLISFKTHYYNMNHQQTQFQKIISQLSDNEVVIVADFSENYEAKLCTEIQAMHFGASKRQITLHTGMIYWNNTCQSFCSIANANNHQPAAIWAHLAPVIKLIEKETPPIVHFYTDGPSSQYKQKNNFYLLSHFTEKYGFQYATWNYYESGHGKSVADGIGGSVKRTLDRKVTLGADVTNAEDAYSILKRCMKSVEIFLIQDNAIDEIATVLPSNVQPLKGTQKVHQIITQNNNMIKYRDISCFCQKGLCDCFSPQTHILLKNLISADLHKQKHIEEIKECVIAPDCCAVDEIDVASLLNEPLCSDIFENESNKKNIDEPLLLQDLPFIVLDSHQMWQNTIDVYSDEILDTNVSMTHNATPSPKNDTMRQHITDETTLFSQNVLKRKTTTTNVPNDTKKFKPKAFLDCSVCYSSILGQKIKCISCKKWTCDDCVNDITAIDYICDKCLEGIIFFNLSSFHNSFLLIPLCLLIFVSGDSEE